MRACTCPTGHLGPCHRPFTRPDDDAHRLFSDRARVKRMDRVTPTYLPYSRPIASFASDRDSLPYCPVIGQSHSTPSSRPVSLVLCSLIYPGPDISTTDGLPRTPALNAFLWASSPDRSQAQCYFTYARAAERNRCFRPVLQIYSSPNAEKPPTRIRSTVNVPRQLYAIRRGGNFGYRSATRCFRLRNRSFIGR